ncbi:MAG: BrnT family toxin [Candidatus Omnitrophica bacterium]|nr:BrnT family toxin [Candidatus Omnitrophota bacterium]
MVLKFEPWGKDPVFDWDEGNLEEIWKHRVRDFEVEECFDNQHVTIPHKKVRSEPKKYGDRYEISGVTDGGRKLIVIVQYLGGNWIRPITARQI